MVNRRERILVLLDNYVDVVNGLRDRSGDGVHVPLMCRAWNKPALGYPELERLRTLLRSERPTLHRHLAQRYLITHSTRRVNHCPRCKTEMAPWSSVNFHRHGGQNVAIQPKVIRLIPGWVQEPLVQQAIEWLDERWSDPGPFLPDELKVEEAKRGAA